MISALIFDLDGTLLDRDAASARWFRGVIEERTDLVSLENRPAALARFVELDASGYPDRARFCREVLAAFPSLAESPAHFWYEFSAGLARSVVLEPPVLQMVEQVRVDHLIAILTNGSIRNQRAKLKTAGLSSIRTFVSEEIGFEKPDRRAFIHVLEALGVEPASTLFVGDDPERDIAGAQAAGLATCWVSRGRSWQRADLRPDHVVARAEEVADLEELRT